MVRFDVHHDGLYTRAEKQVDRPSVRIALSVLQRAYLFYGPVDSFEVLNAQSSGVLKQSMCGVVVGIEFFNNGSPAL